MNNQRKLNQNLAFKEKLIRIISHDIQSPLHFLADIAQKLHERSLSNSHNEVKDISWQLQKASNNIHQFVEDLSLWLTKMQKDFYVQNACINAAALVNELVQLFAEQSAAKGNKMITDVEPELCVYTDRNILKTILRNIIDNANKNTRNGTIFIKITTINEDAVITINDTGIGICAELLKEIQVVFTQSESCHNSNTRPLGFGYVFIADFTRLLRIDFTIESTIGTGTVITLKHIKSKKIS